MPYLNMFRKQPVALLLEDEPLIAFDMADALRDAGLAPVLHFSCATADAWLRDNLPDVAILDVNMSDGVCTDTAGTLAGHHIPFIVHSADVMFSESHGIFNAGRRIDKPCVSTDIAAAAMMLVLATEISGAAADFREQASRA